MGVLLRLESNTVQRGTTDSDAKNHLFWLVSSPFFNKQESVHQGFIAGEAQILQDLAMYRLLEDRVQRAISVN